MHTLKGGCHCGNLALTLTLPQAPATYHPRACDCGFCLKHGAAYLADPHGSLRIAAEDPAALVKYRQGSHSVDFLLCGRCGVLVGVTYQDQDGLFAVVNASAFDDTFGERQPVSPYTLPTEEKIRRWKQLWCADVALRLGVSGR